MTRFFGITLPGGYLELTGSQQNVRWSDLRWFAYLLNLHIDHIEVEGDPEAAAIEEDW